MNDPKKFPKNLLTALICGAVTLYVARREVDGMNRRLARLDESRKQQKAYKEWRELVEQALEPIPTPSKDTSEQASPPK
ncbi:hypothetical protein M408DRAFT_29223 [Serendipita vermifera MAFF 305830]|uniref:Uncharacterized protein n=1 Tax=Serendipita vermifera MAFF 305830 TaxID=933852 RepID=A0A0C3ARC8_SERVB|nr:hypothetical protein M408DRAFT_29223 [Serendipita vermifera MAFF 305830]